MKVFSFCGLRNRWPWSHSRSAQTLVPQILQGEMAIAFDVNSLQYYGLSSEYLIKLVFSYK